MSHPSKLAFPAKQRENLYVDLMVQMESAFEDDGTHFGAFRSVVLKLEGYEDSATVVDGSSDRGIDAYRISGQEIDIFQFKSRDFTKPMDPRQAAGPDLLSDAKRIISFLQAPDFANEQKNRGVRAFVHQLQTAIQYQDNAGEFLISVKLAFLYDGLTQQAKNEFELIRQQFESITLFGREVLIDFELIDLDRMLAQLWRETNTKWIDSTGQSSDWVNIQFLSANGNGGFIGDKSAVVMFGRARDLIDAYRRFGYQIFEMNVRCEISKSRVNDAIRRQVATKKGIDEFRLLNNGVTIICNNRKQPSGTKVEVHQPQIVNGLQTVTSLEEAYGDLSPEMQTYFDEHCYVLVRIYDHHAIADVPKLVLATNHQNKMEPRNLVSNDPDQIGFEKSFAKLKWFYERKDFSWTAFDKSDAQWSSLKNYKPRDFKVQSGRSGRPLVRRVDNQEVGQTWLSFIGYVEDAAQRRKLIFDDATYYNRIFKSRVKSHGYDYDFDFRDSRAAEELIPSAPSAEALLLANLTYRVAKENVLPATKLRPLIIQERRWSGLPEEEVNRRLTSDSDYVTGLALSAGPLLFTEMVGLLLIRAFGQNLYGGAARVLLQHTDMASVYENLDFEPIRSKAASYDYTSNDVFCSLWLMFKNIVKTELAEAEQWRTGFLTESSKPRMMYRPATRRRILSRALELDILAEKRPLNYDFSRFMDNNGVLSYLRAAAVPESV